MVILGSRIDATDDVDTLRHEEGVITHLVLLAIGIVVGVIGTPLDIDLKYGVAVFLGVGFTRSDDIVEGVTRAVEGVQDRRTHLAVHIRGIVIKRVILQCTCGNGVDKVGVHDVETLHHILCVHIDGEGLVDSPRTYLDHIVVLGDQGVFLPGKAAL